MVGQSGQKRILGLLAVLAISGCALGQIPSRVYDISNYGQTGNDYTAGAQFQGFSQSDGDTVAQFAFNGQWAQFGQVFHIPVDWSAYNGYSFTVENLEDVPVTYGMRFDTSSDYSTAVTTHVTIKPHSKVRYFLDLSNFDPETLGMQSNPPVLSTFYENIQPSAPAAPMNRVYRWQIYNTSSSVLHAKFSSIDGYAFQYDFNNLTDQFGQYARRSWQSKVVSSADLLTNLADENADLAIHPGTGEQTGSNYLWPRPAGKWRVTKTGSGKYYFVHPSGKLFWSLGVTSVTNTTPTVTTGREYMFQQLPSQNDPEAQFYSTVQWRGKTVQAYNFYGANLMHKFGATWQTDWMDNDIRRLKSWGLNTLGTGSDLSNIDKYDMPYCLTVTTDNYPTKLPMPQISWRQIPDPYGADFYDWMVANWAPSINSFNSDPNFMGVYTDGENMWGIRDNLADTYMLPIATMACPASQPAKYALMARLMATYGSIARLNKYWNTNYASWNDLINPCQIDTAHMNDNMIADFKSFLTVYMRTYYYKIRCALKTIGCNALWLGSKDCMWWAPDEVFKAQAQFADVVTGTYYADSDNVPWDFFNSLPRPFMIAEFSFLARDRSSFLGNIAPDIDSPDQNARAALADKYMRQALACKDCLGVHWFTFVDQMATGRLDSENYAFGLVDVTDTPYAPLVNEFRNFSAQMYKIRGG